MNQIGFHEVQDSFIVTYKGGVYKQSKLYRNGNRLYVAVSGGFVALRHNGSTSVSNLLWRKEKSLIELPTRIDQSGYIEVVSK